MKTNEIAAQNYTQGYGDAMDMEMDKEPSVASKPLTAENLQAASIASSKKAGKKGAKAGKPAWAQTAAQMEDAKEAEIDDLLEFAYELDYEKYMEDYEVRQALGIIKDRVKEMTQEEDWKEKMAQEWNEANEAEKQAKEAKRAARAAAAGADEDLKS